jgi:hypothetical protein
MVRLLVITKYLKFGNTAASCIGEQRIVLQICLCFTKLQCVIWFVIMYHFYTWKLFIPFMKELVHYVETVLNCSTISPSIYPFGLSGVPLLYGKKQNDNTEAVSNIFMRYPFLHLYTVHHLVYIADMSLYIFVVKL